MKKIDLASIVGKGYASFWNFKGRYRVVKGSRASKKSKTIALWYIINMMLNPEANLLVIRRTGNTLRDSCYAELLWAINRIDKAFVDSYGPKASIADKWDPKLSPLYITYKPTGQKILFRGLDDAQKVTSTTITKGVLCWAWIEEAFQVTDETEFNKLDGSIRGEVPDGYFKQLTFSFNPWSDRSWLKRRFFDVKDPDIFAITTTYMQNEWLDEADRRYFDNLRENFPRRYRIEGLGEWGISEGLIYERVESAPVDIQALIKANPALEAWYGIDFGFTDPTAFVGGLIDTANRVIYIGLEWYKRGVTNNEIADAIKFLGLKREQIYCDSAEPKSIKELKDLGLNALAATKGQDSVRHGIQYLQNYRFIVSPYCPDTYESLCNYVWKKDKDGKTTDVPDHEFSHGPDAIRYGLDRFINNNSFKWQKLY